MTNKPQFVGERVSFTAAFSEVSRGVKKFKQNEYAEYGAHPIVDQGQESIAGYSDDETGLFNDVPAIVFGDHTRCVKYVEEPFFAGADGVKILKPRLSDNARFWWHELKATPIENLGYSRHFKLLKAATFKTYDTVSQTEIVVRLDSILDQIAQANQKIEQLDQLVKSRFVEMFGDPISNSKQLDVKPGSALFKIGNGKSKPISERYRDGIPAYGGNGISWYSKECLINNPTIVIGRVGRHCGNTRLVNEPCWVTDNAMYIKQFLNDYLDLIYLDELMRLVGFNRYADKGDLWKITQQPFMDFAYPMPSIEEQRDFAAFVAQVDKSRFAGQLSALRLTRYG